jgi:hypothetical protein
MHQKRQRQNPGKLNARSNFAVYNEADLGLPPTVMREIKSSEGKTQRSSATATRRFPPLPTKAACKNAAWIIVGAPGSERPLESKKAAEDYCMQHFRQFPVTIEPATTSQELPQKSVWTGAPWDQTFEHLR